MRQSIEPAASGLPHPVDIVPVPGADASAQHDRAADSRAVGLDGRKVMLFANTDWYLYNFRMSLIRELANRGAEVVLVTPEGPYVQKLERECARWLPLNMERRSLNPIDQLAVLLRLAHLYGAERPDFVHHFTLKCVVLGSLAARMARVPRMINAVAGLGTVYSSDDRRALRWALTRLLRIANASPRTQVIAQNPDDAALLRRARVAPDQRTHLIRGSGVDGSRFAAQRAPERGKVCRILFAARLLWSKGIGHFVDAARALAGQNVEFLVAGAPDDGNPDAVDRAYLARCADEGCVRVLGHVDDMAGLLSDVDVVVLPSSYGEGVPRILVEAAAASLPLIAFDVAGSREIVCDGVNGLLVSPGDQDGLETALRLLAENRDLRGRMGRASREHFETEYDEITVNSKTLSLYVA